MIKVLFVCYGNICRSVMAEMILKELVSQKNVKNEFVIASCATSQEEIGNPIYYKAREVLENHYIHIEEHQACQIKAEDYFFYDYIIGMDNDNISMLHLLFKDNKKKIYRLLDFTDRKKEIDDPWYTRDFETCFYEIKQGCLGFLDFLSKNE